MAISRKRKVMNEEEQNDWSTHPMEFEDNDPVEVSDNRDDKIKSLEQQLADLHERIDDDKSDRLLQNFQTQPLQNVEFKGEQLVQVPNINEDPDGWAAAVQKNAAIEARNTVGRDQNQRQNTGNIDQQTQALWDSFNEDYSDFADMGMDKVEFAATRVAKRAKDRGLDVGRYMFVTRDRFLRDVSKEMERTFGAPEEGDDDFENDTYEERPTKSRRREARTDPLLERSTRRKRNRSENADNGRTAGVFGGADSGSRPSGNEQDDGRGMIDDFQNMQRRTGFF